MRKMWIRLIKIYWIRKSTRRYVILILGNLHGWKRSVYTHVQNYVTLLIFSVGKSVLCHSLSKFLSSQWDVYIGKF